MSWDACCRKYRSSGSTPQVKDVRSWEADSGPATNGALTNDLLRSPADAGRALAFLVLGGNTFGLCAPIVTGYLVEATGSFDSAFIAAGVLALVGATAALTLSRGTLGEVKGTAKAALAS